MSCKFFKYTNKVYLANHVRLKSACFSSIYSDKLKIAFITSTMSLFTKMLVAFDTPSASMVMIPPVTFNHSSISEMVMILLD